jgi:SAM-dependent methyltransferase
MTMTIPPDLQRWNERFAAPGYLFGTAPNAFLAAQRSRLPKRGDALAIADGEGRNGVWLAKQGLAVTAIDFSPVALAKARELAAREGVQLATIETDIGAWSWPAAAYDVVAAIFIQFAPPPQRATLFANMKRALRRGGLLLLEGYRPKQIDYKTGGPPHAENMYTRELLEAAFGDMTILHLAEHDSVIEEGTGHKGLSALIDLVAEKR